MARGEALARKYGSRQRWLPMFQEFISNLRIDSKEVQAEDENGARLLLWSSQDMAMKTICQGLEDGIRDFYFLKCRQAGITTITLAIDIFWLLVHPRTIGALVCDTPENSATFRNTIDRMLASLPEKFVGKNFKAVRNNKVHLLLPNGSRLDYLIAGTKNKTTWAESRGYTMYHVTEISKFGTRAGIDSFREAVAETHPNRLGITESTANGWANHWHDIWDEAGRDELTKKRCFIGWWAKDLNRIKPSDKRFEVYGASPPNSEERELMAQVYESYRVKVSQEQLAWYRWRASNQSADDGSLAQNNPWTAEEAFVRTGYSFFQLKVIHKRREEIHNIGTPFKGYRFYLGETLEAGQIEQIMTQERLSEVEFKVWEEPVKGATYVIGLDPAFGREDYSDNHCVSVCRAYADKLIQVAEYASNTVETHHAAWVMAYICSWYRPCWPILELGGPGRAVLRELDIQRQRLRSATYRPNVKEGYEQEEFLEHCQWYMYHRPDSPGSGYLWHFETNQRTKWELMNQFRDSWVTNMFQTSSVRLLDEMETMVQERGDIGPASPGGSRKDDRVFAAALCNRAWLDWVRPQMIDEGYVFDKVDRRERGEEEKPDKSEIANLIAQGFLAKLMADADEMHGDTFLAERGLE